MELDNGLRFIANFKYTLKDDISNDLLNEKNLQKKIGYITTETEEAFDMHCDQTMVGFVQEMAPEGHLAKGDMKQMKTVCFYGE